tara:strand:- start:60 stop:263 length:204 start_codon:yes stop_codon:yes gene_type:complete
MPTFISKTISTAEADKIIAAYDRHFEGTPALADIEARLLEEVQTRVRDYEDTAAVRALGKSAFDITS